MRWRCSTAILLAGILLARVAAADGSEHAAQAEQLFARGKQLLVAKKAAEACPLLEESYRLDPAGGTLQNLAVCYEELQRWASAYARFEELRTLSKNTKPPRPDRIALAEAHIEKLKPKLSQLTIEIAGQPPGAVVTVDGVVHNEVSYKAGVIVDPGRHVITVRAEGKLPEEREVEISAAAAQTVTFGPLAEAPRPKVAPAPAPPSIPRETHPTRPAGIIVGSLGIVMIGGGLLAGALAASKSAEGTDACHGGTGDDFASDGTCITGSGAWEHANALKDDARSLANVANVLVPVGIVTTAVGAWLFVRTRVVTSAFVTVTPAGASLRGVF